ncbi:glycerate kinase [Mariniphaga anaerophila]|uniref:Glycerate kinase n=2 Tax=Mariniphaga anaerophila TaxID=1484053 RepID=A0A1M4TUU0_9BACT|nr:glycerate kinase [Mariniphaga anaerophila]
MKVLVAPNSMKGSLNAFEFADVVEKAFFDVSSDFIVRKVPVADGGDFTGEVLCRALNAVPVEVEVKDPLGRLVQSKYAKIGQKAIIEMADASGIKLLRSNELNPMETSSFGTGQLIRAALKDGCTEILLGVGGSATVDGGLGMLAALGYKLIDEQGRMLEGKGGSLRFVKKIEPPALVENFTVNIICDVHNPLLGKNGAAAVFGPQKGATPEMVGELEAGLANWAGVLENQCGKDFSGVEGAGAAGGIVLPLLACCNAKIVPGAAFVLNQLNFQEHVNWADVVITGEGKLDGQTLCDKAPKAVADVAREQKKPVFAIGGTVTGEATDAFDGIFSMIPGPISLEEAMSRSGEMLYQFSFEFAKLIRAMRF